MSEREDEEAGPREVPVLDFIKGRAAEISDLLAVVDNRSLPAGEVCQGPRTFMQRLPRQLRRRAMSHNVKRFPRRLRPMVTDSLVKAVANRRKPPSRYYRRRPANLLQAYVRRQRKQVWLETHIWHAKRFRMSMGDETWGYRLAQSSCARGFRPSYRDATRHCLVQDVSYLVCLQLEGKEDHLVRALAACCSPELGPTFALKYARDGSAEVETIIYRPGQFPYGCVGPVKFHWKPIAHFESLVRVLWIWAHPCMLEQVIAIFKDVFSLVEQVQEPEDMERAETLKEWFAIRSKLSLRCFRSTINECCLTILKDHLVRFRLVGPKSTQVLKQVIQFPVVKPGAHEKHTWWTELVADDNDRLVLHNQKQLWDGISVFSSPGEHRTGQILAVVANDPRSSRVQRKRLISGKPSSDNNSSPINPVLPASPIWDISVRNSISEMKAPDHQLNELRHQQLFSGVVPPEALQSLIPALVICQSNSQSGGWGILGSGWDLVLPSGWAMSFWIAIQYATARAAGLRETRMMSVESGRPYFPDDWPDTNSGATAELQQKEKLRQKYEKRPANRRVDYDSLKVKYPFRFPWSELVTGCLSGHDDVGPDDTPLSAHVNNFYVLRSRKLLRQLALWIQGKNSNGEAIAKEHGRALVPVRLKSVGKGCPKTFAMICQPKGEDLEGLRSLGKKPPGKPVWETTTKKATNLEASAESQDTKSIGGQDINSDVDWLTEDFVSIARPCEVVNMDELVADETEQRSLKRKQKNKEKKKKKESSTIFDENATFGKNVVFNASRKLFGFISRGDFVFSTGCGLGFGYCSAAALPELLQTWKNYQNSQRYCRNRCFVLYRNSTSKRYRAAEIEIAI